MDELTEKLRSLLKGRKGTTIALAVGILGIFLILISDFVPSEKSENSEATDNDTQAFVNDAQLEIAGIVKAITGESSPAVYITASSGLSRVFALEIKSSENSREEEVVIVKNSDGNQTGLLISETQPVIRGVVVVSEGADDPVVREKIISAVKTAFGISSGEVCVVPKYKGTKG